ncbi:MAG: hypothetical protein IJ462_03430 [Clostridia bacterium]|nr:hypothetical protein [Clostridia bacterium]
MKKLLYRSVALVIISVLLILCFTACGEEDSSTASVTQVPKEDFVKQYTDSMTAYKQNTAVQFNEKSEISYKRYKTTVRSSVSTDIGVIYGEDKTINDMRVSYLWTEGFENVTSSIAYQDGNVYNQIVNSDFNTQYYTSKEKQEDVLKFLSTEMQVTYFDENIDISQFSSITKENVTDKGYSIVIAEPAAQYLTTLYGVYKNCIESKLATGSKMVSFKGIFNYDTAGKLQSREYEYVAQESENESVTVKNILTVNKINSDVSLETIQKQASHKKVDSVFDLYYLNNALINVELKNGSVSGEETISMKGVLDFDRKSKIKVQYSTKNDRLTFDGESKVTLKQDLLGLSESYTNTQNYADGKYKSVINKKFSSKTLTEVQAAQELRELCIIVPFDVSDITSIACSNKDGVQKYTFRVGEYELKRFIAPILGLKEQKEGTVYGVDDITNLIVDEKKSKAEVTVKDGKVTKQSCTYVVSLEQNGIPFDITIKQNLTFTDKEASK